MLYRFINYARQLFFAYEDIFIEATDVKEGLFSLPTTVHSLKTQGIWSGSAIVRFIVNLNANRSPKKHKHILSSA